MTPDPTPKPDPALLAEQVLELLAEHIASNDRVAAALERAETRFPKEAARILTEHRQSMANLPPAAAPEPAPPSEAPFRAITDALYMWGTLLAVLTVGGAVTVLWFLLRR